MRMVAARNRKMAIGIIATVGFAVFMILIFQKQAIITALGPGDSVDVQFPRDYKLEVDNSKVKMAGTPVGTVSGIEQGPHGTTTVSLKLDDGVLDKLGSAPMAEIRPTTVLGGKYYVSLVSGGNDGPFDGETIPPQRTRTPVELDRVLQAFPRDARTSLQHTMSHLDQTLNTGSSEALDRVLRNAPGTLRPASQVANAFLGSRPQTDLSTLVPNVDRIATALTQRNGQLENVIDSLNSTTGTLAGHSQTLASTIDTMPDTLRSTRAGVLDLRGTLSRLRNTADAARPTVHQLDPLLKQLNPVLAEARPVVGGLRPLLADARPAVDDLSPVSQRGASVLNDVRGPVINRINGPIVQTIMREWHGHGPKYPHGGGTGNKFYEELAGMFANIDNAAEKFDQNGHYLNFQPGAGTSSVMGAPSGLDQLLERLSNMFGPPNLPGKPPLNLNNPLLKSMSAVAPQQFGRAASQGQASRGDGGR
jgi:phospholipid/cholesterol/gamma-HCH transport system substrate-binding protein